MKIILVEDPLVARLYPISVSRPCFAITVGSYHLLDHARAAAGSLAAVVRPHLRSLITADYPDIQPLPGDTAGEPVLLVNARVVPSMETRAALVRLTRETAPGVLRKGETMVAARLAPGTVLPPGDLELGAVAAYLESLSGEPLDAEFPLLEYPHDIIRHHANSIGGDLQNRIRQADAREIADGVYLADGATLGQYTVTKTSSGPILIDRGATIGPNCYLEGPAYIGPGTRVIEHSAIKDAVSLGHTTKIGGEVECSVIEPYTNKQHHGFLGHSYLGSWINLGAGTCNSDLKNTYGTVNMEYRSEKVATGMQFVGSFVGDYAKTAINTGIFTGKTIGVCSMVYGFVTSNVPSFVNYARIFNQVTATPVEVMVATQARMFARRQVQQRVCDIQLLHDMHDLTRHERELGSVPPEPLSL